MEFGAYLDEALRDCLVCGLRNEGIQKKLLTEADLTRTKVLTLSLGMEAAEKNAKSLKVVEPAVNRITPRPCYRCGRTSHNHKDCRFKEAECHKCEKKRHIAATCRSAKAANACQPQRKHVRFNRFPMKFVTTDTESDSESLPLHTNGGGGANPPLKTLT